MDAVTGALEAAAREAGAELVTGAEATAVAADGRTGEVTFSHGDAERIVAGDFVLAGVAPAVLDRLRGRPVGRAGGRPDEDQHGARPPAPAAQRPRPGGRVRRHLPRRRGLRRAGGRPRRRRRGTLPDPPPGEVYCHTLTDPSILAPDLAARGVHTLTLFGLHAPARLFAGEDAAAVRDEAARRHVAGLDAYLAEPLAGCLARDADGRPCLEAVSPPELEASLGMPGGHIFHGDLAWPWAGDDGGPGARPGSGASRPTSPTCSCAARAPAAAVA